MKKNKKIDFKMDSVLYEQINFIVKKFDLQRSAWIRRTLEDQANKIFDIHDLEEEYNAYRNSKH